MRIAAITALLAVAVITGCGGQTKSESGAQPAVTTPPTPKTQRLTWGQPAEVLGANLTKIRVTPLGVLYERGGGEVETAANGWFVVIAVKAEALTKPDTTSGGAGGGGFEWRGAGQTINSIDGNTTTTAWIGAVPEFGITEPIEVGDPREGIETFDVPAKGGRLVYISPEDYSISATWDIPAADQGSPPRSPRSASGSSYSADNPRRSPFHH